MTKIYQMMLNGGMANGRQLIKSETLAEMTRNQIGALKARPGMPWGYGFCVVTDPTQQIANHTLSPGSFGHGGAFGTDSWADPTRGLIYVFMIQRDALKPHAGRFGHAPGVPGGRGGGAGRELAVGGRIFEWPRAGSALGWGPDEFSPP